MRIGTLLVGEQRRVALPSELFLRKQIRPFGCKLVPTHDLTAVTGFAAQDTGEASQKLDLAEFAFVDLSHLLLVGWIVPAKQPNTHLPLSMHHPRIVIVGLATGDVAVGSFEFEVDYGDDVNEADIGTSAGDTDILRRVDYRDEGAEDGIANNGTRTVTVAEVRSRHIDGQWLIDSIAYR